MADNPDIAYTTTAGAGQTLLKPAADDVGGVLFQRIKVQVGADGSAADATSALPFPVGVQEQVGGTFVGGTVGVTTSSSTLLAAGTRLWVEFANNSDTTWWIALGGAAVVSTGLMVPPGASKLISGWNGDVRGIHGGSGTKSGGYATLAL